MGNPVPLLRRDRFPWEFAHWKTGIADKLLVLQQTRGMLTIIETSFGGRTAGLLECGSSIAEQGLPVHVNRRRRQDGYQRSTDRLFLGF